MLGNRSNDCITSKETMLMSNLAKKYIFISWFRNLLGDVLWCFLVDSWTSITFSRKHITYWFDLVGTSSEIKSRLLVMGIKTPSWKLSSFWTGSRITMWWRPKQRKPSKSFLPIRFGHNYLEEIEYFFCEVFLFLAALLTSSKFTPSLLIISLYSHLLWIF